VSGSVVADAFLPNFQERVFEYGASRVEVTYFTNLLSLVLMTVSFGASGDIGVREQDVWCSVQSIHIIYILIYV
jgi:hypothetical protein